MTTPAAPEWIDAGERSATELHALYTGLAASTPPDAPPRVLWMRSREAHVSVGGSQDPEADLDLDHCAARGIPVVRRPLGGGSVWVDADQDCFFVIRPSRVLTRGPRHLFAQGLAMAVDVLRELGLQGVEPRGQDVWVQGRKIMGTGAATLNEGSVFGASFLGRFPVEDFLACVRAPSEGYREWLRPVLEAGMTDCAGELGRAPDSAALRDSLRRVTERRFEAPPVEMTPDAATLEAWLAAGYEELDDLADGDARPSVPEGIRVNRDNHVFETRVACGRLRLHVEGQHIARVWCEDPAVDRVLGERVAGELPERLHLRSRLAGCLDPAVADAVSARIDALYRGIA